MRRAQREAPPTTIVIDRITLAAELDTDEVKTAYDGSTYIENHHDEPSAGMRFAVVTLSASKNRWSADALNYSDFQLLDQSLNGFSGLADSRFLSAHNYLPISAGQITTSVSGSTCLEIAESYLSVTPDGWTASCGGYTSGYYSSSAVPNVPKVSAEITQQEKREDALLTQYALREDQTLENAMIVQDVYGNAPLSAVALFETGSACTVTVTVRGKTADADITYPVASADTHHEVPIFGGSGGGGDGSAVGEPPTPTVTVPSGGAVSDSAITSAVTDAGKGAENSLSASASTTLSGTASLAVAENGSALDITAKGGGVLTVQPDVLQALNLKAADKLSVGMTTAASTIPNAIAFEGNLAVNGAAVHTLGGKMTIDFPMDAAWNGKTVILEHLHADGSVTYTGAVAKDGKATATVTDFSTFTVRLASDMPATTFAPGTAMTRQQMRMVLSYIFYHALFKFSAKQLAFWHRKTLPKLFTVYHTV